MTKDEIIAMAVEAKLIRVGGGWTEPHRWGLAELEVFANLVASVEREEILQMSREKWFKTQADFEAAIAARWKHD